MFNEYSDKIKEFPIFPLLDDISDQLKSSKSHCLILKAETGAGKSTTLPLSMLKNFSGNIYMLEPRRLAALNIASRVSELLEEPVGETCGYTVHLENKTSSKTRFTVMTEAVLTRKLQSDPLLDGVNVVILDEFHERSIHTDLALALLKEVLSVRDDLYLVIMSATIDTDKLCDYFEGTDKVPVVSVEGRQFPVEIEYKGDSSIGKEVLRAIDDLKASEENGSVLVFLPGLYEIKQLEKELCEKGTDVPVYVLHSSVPLNEQKKVLNPEYCKGYRIILSSAIAETSLTVPDVKVVVDSGEMRLNLFNNSTGMNSLVTRKVTEFNAKQRTGRAGRISAGKCIRMWAQNEILVKTVTPEILRADLADLVLECFKWGCISIDKLSWLDSPSEASWDAAVNFLELLGCIRQGKITALGEACLESGVNVRIACVALSGILYDSVKLSTDYAVDKILSRFENERTLVKSRENLILRVQKWVKNPQIKACFPQGFTQFSTSYALLCGYPDRIGKLVEEGIYQFPSGRKAKLKDSKECGNYLIALCINEKDSSGIIYEWESVKDTDAETFMSCRANIVEKAEFTETSSLKKTAYECYGKIILSKKSVKVSDSDYLAAVQTEVERKGMECLPLNEKTKNFLIRVQFYCENKGTDKGILDKFETLEQSVPEWLEPFMPAGTKLSPEIVYNSLFWYLEGDRINESVPVELMLENGKKRKLSYEVQNGKIVPVLEVIIQHIFGCFKTPRIMGKPVLLRLLSPARRPLQVTQDLENFWENTWKEICTEMKGRYPKHNWDYKVSTDEN